MASSATMREVAKSAVRARHVAAVVAYVLYWAVVVAGSQFAIQPPWVLHDVWYSGAPWVVGMIGAVGVGLFVARWWVLVAAITPVAVLGALEVSGHRSPWHDSGPPLTQYGWGHVAWWLFWLFVLPLLIGVAVRRGLGARGPTALRSGGAT